MTAAGLVQRARIDDFASRAAGHAFTERDEDGDFRFNPDLTDAIRNHATKEAAVLIGVIDRGGEAHMVLTKRTEAMRTHSGQIAFPGGRIDPGDASPEAAALRECEEETGIGPAWTRLVGRMPVYLSGSGFRIHPVLAVIEGDPPMRPNPDEVDAIFEVPLAHLMDAANHGTGSVHWKGRDRLFYEMPYGGYRIWGVTAGIIRMVYERLYA